MIYKNKLYAIPDIAKRLKIKESDIRLLINGGIIATVNMYGAEFLEGFVALNLVSEIKKFNESLKKEPEGSIKIPKGSLMND